MAISQNTLRQEGTAYRARNASKPKTASIHENFATTTKRKAFLCHSHKDIDLVEGLL